MAAGRKGFGAGNLLKGLIRSANTDSERADQASLSAADQVFHTLLYTKSFPSITSDQGVKRSVWRAACSGLTARRGRSRAISGRPPLAWECAALQRRDELKAVVNNKLITLKMSM